MCSFSLGDKKSEEIGNNMRYVALNDNVCAERALHEARTERSETQDTDDTICCGGFCNGCKGAGCRAGC